MLRISLLALTVSSAVLFASYYLVDQYLGPVSTEITQFVARTAFQASFVTLFIGELLKFRERRLAGELRDQVFNELHGFECGTFDEALVEFFVAHRKVQVTTEGSLKVNVELNQSISVVEHAHELAKGMIVRYSPYFSNPSVWDLYFKILELEQFFFDAKYSLFALQRNAVGVERAVRLIIWGADLFVDTKTHVGIEQLWRDPDNAELLEEARHEVVSALGVLKKMPKDAVEAAFDERNDS